MPLMRIELKVVCLLFAGAFACSREVGGPQGPGPETLALKSTTAQAVVPSEAVFNPCPMTVPTCLIMPLGDSLTAGVGNEGDAGYRGELARMLQRTGRAFDFVGTMPPGGVGSGHEGHPGAHIQLLASYADIWLPLLKPHVVLTMLGTNDLDYYVTDHIEEYNKVLDRMFALLPNSLFVVAAVPPFGADDSTAVDFNRKLLTLLQTKAASGKHVIAVDMHSAMLLRDLGPDKTHPLPSGYLKIAAVWHSVLARFMRPAP